MNLLHLSGHGLGLLFEDGYLIVAGKALRSACGGLRYGNRPLGKGGPHALGSTSAHTATPAHAHASTATLAHTSTHAAAAAQAHASTASASSAHCATCHWRLLGCRRLARIGAWRTGQAGLAGHVRFIHGIQLPRLELFKHVHGRSAAAYNHANPRRRERLIRLGPAIACQDELDVLFRHQLGRLDTRTAAQHHARILHRFEIHAVGIDDQKTRAASEPGIDVRFQGRPRCGNRYVHDGSFPAGTRAKAAHCQP